MIIRTSNLGKRFNREWIFKGLTTHFEIGKVYALTGPNGSGKSTLMRVLWGQEPASEGNIQYECAGKSIEIEEIFKYTSIVTPYMDLIEEFSTIEHLNFHFRFKRPIEGLGIDEMINKLRLQDAMDKPIKAFSSGMKQRLKLGIAFFSQADILFLDEPTTNLDDQTIQWYFDNLMEIRAKKLVLIATNQPSDYPTDSTILNLTELKQVTKRNS